MSLQICAPVSVIRNEKPNNSNNTCPYKTAKVRHLPQQIQSLSAQPPLPNVKHALADTPSQVSQSDDQRSPVCRGKARQCDIPRKRSTSSSITDARPPASEGLRA